MGLILDENEFTSKSTSPKLIGETFTTLRTGIIDGAVEQDGSQYNFSDFPEIKVLLENNELPYIPITRFDTMVAEQGGCNSFGYNESGTFYGWDASYFGGVFYTKSETPQAGDDLFQKENGVIEKVDAVYKVRDSNRIEIDGDGHTATRDTSLDETIPESTYFKVPKKVVRVLVRTQKPTADNNYTWYNLYSDGWVEQGCGRQSGSEVPLPISMSDTEYTCLITSVRLIKETERFRIAGNESVFAWTVKGYASSFETSDSHYSEYFHNLNYERHMIQLK